MAYSKKLRLKYFLLTIPTFVLSAQAECVMQSKTVSTQKIVISKRTDVNRNIIQSPTGERKCVVNFQVEIASKWHMATGEYAWDGQRPSSEACAAAVALAERDVQAKLQGGAAISENILVCNDDPDRMRLQQSHPGTIGNLAQFRPHPEYPNAFYHNGTQCRWFVETAYESAQIKNYLGVICKLETNQWVVVDRF